MYEEKCFYLRDLVKEIICRRFFFPPGYLHCLSSVLSIVGPISRYRAFLVESQCGDYKFI
jgi:hypothetical protein